MSPPNLATIPIELLHEICGLVKHNHPPTLRCLSLVNKHCRRAASAFLLCNLHIRINSTQQICDDVNSLSNALRAVDGLACVRWLRITVDFAETYAESRSCDSSRKENTWQQRRRKDETETMWLTLAHFVSQLPKLEDLVYSSDSQQFPAILLATLQTDAKEGCRLHLHDFYLRSLIRQPSFQSEDHVELDSYESELVGSPNLYCITMWRPLVHKPQSEEVPPSHSSRGLLDYNTDAMPQIASFVPNLKVLSCTLSISAFDRRRGLPMSSRQARPRWPGLTLETPKAGKTRQRKAEPEKLTIGGQDGIEMGMLQQWDRHVDFDKLRTLKLVGSFCRSSLFWLKERRRFASLSVLHAEAYTIGTFNAFLNTVPPLHTLYLQDYPGTQIPRAIIDYHGATLCRLSIPGHAIAYYPYAYYEGLICSPTDVQELMIYCPSLEELTITISRSGVNHDEEKAIYQAFGSHSCLQRINLILDCSVDVRGDLTFEDSFDEQTFEWTPPWTHSKQTGTRNGHVRRSLMTCAIDRSLVQEVFQLIASSKPSDALRLQHLEIQVANAGKFPDDSIPPRQKASPFAPTEPHDGQRYVWEDIFAHMTRRWRACRYLRSDSSPDVAVEEIPYTYNSGKCLRERGVSEGGVLISRPGNVYPIHQDGEPYGLGCVEPHFRALWPAGATGDPRDDWHSFPLGK
ncbi:hypothetical protein Q7P37_006196 [Cladosporium fusiforme]